MAKAKKNAESTEPSKAPEKAATATESKPKAAKGKSKAPIAEAASAPEKTSAGEITNDRKAAASPKAVTAKPAEAKTTDKPKTPAKPAAATSAIAAKPAAAAKAAAKSPAAKPAPSAGGFSLGIDTDLVARAAANLVVNRDSIASASTEAKPSNQPEGGKNESTSFKNLKQNLSQPGAALNKLLGIPGGGKKSGPFGGGHASSGGLSGGNTGSGGNRVGVPRRTNG
jgi:hypothetical protein